METTWGHFISEDNELEFVKQPIDQNLDLMNNLVEVSMNFDLDQVEVFLHRIISLIDSGFGEHDVNPTMASIDHMKMEEEREVCHSIIRYKGEKMLFNIRVFMDDVDAPDLYIFTQKSLAEAINNLMYEFRH